MNGRIVFRVFLSLVLVAAIVGAGIYVYNIGLTQGRVEGTQLANPGSGASSYPPYWYGPYFHPFGFGFPLFGLFFFLIFLFFVTRLLFWGPRHGWGRHFHGEGRDFPSQLDEWHRKQHETSPEGK